MTEGTPLPEGTEILETVDGIRYTEIDGENYFEADDGSFYHESMFEPDEPAADDGPPAWAQPLLERHAQESEADIRADERARVETELADEESPLVEWLQDRPHLLADFDNFQVAVDKAGGDLEMGQQLYEGAMAEHTDTLDRARRHENVGQPRSYDEAMDNWFAETHAAAAVEPLRQDAPKDDLGSALNDFTEELHQRNATDRAARSLVREQERRGR